MSILLVDVNHSACNQDTLSEHAAIFTLHSWCNDAVCVHYALVGIAYSMGIPLSLVLDVIHLSTISV